MSANEVLLLISNLNWQGIVAIFLVNWFFYRKLKEDMKMLDHRMKILDDRMFYLATGRTLADAIKADHDKETT